MVKGKSKQEVFQHFSQSEREFVERMLEVCQRVENSYSYELTHFLNPREEEITRMLAARFGLSCYSSRDWLKTEYARLIIATAYYECEIADFELVLFEIDYPKAYYQLTHAQVLGTLLNRLSIRREYLGDIFLVNDGVFTLLAEQFAPLVENEVVKIAKAPVQFVRRDWTMLELPSEQEGTVKLLLVSSLRLDKLVAAGFSLSRTQASQCIEKGKVRVNYQSMDQTSKTLDIGDLISVRGFGRLQIMESLGFSKQGKIKLHVNLIKK